MIKMFKSHLCFVCVGLYYVLSAWCLISYALEQIEMAQKLLNSDLAELIGKMKLAQQYVMTRWANTPTVSQYATNEFYENVFT